MRRGVFSRPPLSRHDALPGREPTGGPNRPGVDIRPDRGPPHWGHLTYDGLFLRSQPRLEWLPP